MRHMRRMRVGRNAIEVKRMRHMPSSFYSPVLCRTLAMCLVLFRGYEIGRRLAKGRCIPRKGRGGSKAC